MKTCYYELLDVDISASDIELKKAYRKQALRYHPDKNPENIEEATNTFALIRSAYEVLSDPQERAWYDSHKNQILNDDAIIDNDTYSYEVDVGVTGITTDELLMFFNSSLYTRKDDSPAGLYQIAGKIFAKLAKDEVLTGRRMGLEKYGQYQDDIFDLDIINLGYAKACDKYIIEHSEATLFPVFGHLETDYEHLKSFYKRWNSFNTLKSFSWKDEYMYSKSYDRRTKREINKRNEKARRTAKIEYNKTVERFVAFIKKLDKRMNDGAKAADDAKRAKDQRKKQQLRVQSNSNKNTISSEYEVQSWQQVNENYWKELEKTYDEMEDLEGELFENGIPAIIDGDRVKNSIISEDEILVYECVICQKIFKSERQLDNHVKTKLHKRNVHDIQREMKKDSMMLGLDGLSDLDEFDSANEGSGPQDEEERKELDMALLNDEIAELEKQLAELDDSEDEEDEEEVEIMEQNDIEVEISDVEKDSENDGLIDALGDQGTDEDPAEDIEEIDNDLERGDQLNKLLASLNQGSAENTSDDDWGSNKKSKKSKKKANKPKQTQPQLQPCAQQTIPSLQTNDLVTEVCSTCGEAFTSRNTLFKHFKLSNHAAPPSKVRTKSHRNKKK